MILVSLFLPSCPPLPPPYPFCFVFFFNLKRRQVFPLCMPATIWEHATWEQLKQLNELALISEHDSIYFCLAACCFHSCIFYPPYRLDILLYGSGRQPDEGLKQNSNISTLKFNINKSLLLTRLNCNKCNIAKTKTCLYQKDLKVLVYTIQPRLYQQQNFICPLKFPFCVTVVHALLSCI